MLNKKPCQIKESIFMALGWNDIDASFYLFTNPDVAACGVDPAAHYRDYGRHEGRAPRSSFWKRIDVAHWVLDRNFYLEKYPDVASAGVDPVWHYIYHGRDEGRLSRPSLGLISGWHDKRTSILNFWKSADIAHWTLDRRFYLKKYPDVARSGMDPVWHFICYGRGEGRVSRREYELMLEWVSFWKLLLNPIRFLTKKKPTTLSRSQLFGYARDGKVLRLWIGSQSIKQAARFDGKRRFASRIPVTNVETDVRAWIKMKRGQEPANIEIIDHFVIGRTVARQVRHLLEPTQFVASIRRASIMGSFQVISHRQFIHFEPAANPRFDFVAGQSHFVAPVKNFNQVFVDFDYERTNYLEEAVLISGRCGPNYYHWLIEYLGRAYLIAKDSPFRKLPFIVDSRLYPQQIESLKLFFPNVEIYLHDVNHRLNVGLLHIPSIPTYLPDTQKIPLWQGSVLNTSSLNFLRRQGLSLLDKVHSDTSRRVYLTRRSGRMILNNERVEALLEAKGFEICDTGSLTFREQVALFASASVIVGPLGAAFANVIFCSSGCSILGLVSPFAALFPLQARLADFAGCSFKMLPGQQESYVRGDEDRPETITQDLFMGAYQIDLYELEAAVDKL